MRVKDTLNLGKTKFPMRGNLPVREAERQKAWEENKVYERRQKLNEGKPSFVLHDGPPYGTCNEQNFKGYHRSFQVDDGL